MKTDFMNNLSDCSDYSPCINYIFDPLNVCVQLVKYKFFPLSLSRTVQTSPSF